MHHCPRCHAEVPAEARFCRKCGYNQVHTEEMPAATPADQPGKGASTPQTAAGLIRPIGITLSQRPGNPAKPAPAASDLPGPLLATPAHLLALKPLTPSSPKLLSSPQFLRPALPSKVLKPDSQDIAEQQTRQEPVYFPHQNQVDESPQPVSQLPSIEDLPTALHPIEIVKGRPPLASVDNDFVEFEDNFESYVATSQAAEHWRTSWRNRQRSEAGPAASVSRGQSSVAEPLMAMQNSLARIRAIVAPQQKQKKSGASLGFWITIFLMLCLIGGLGAYIASTYLSQAASTLPIDAHVVVTGPTLSVQGLQTTTILQGQVLHLHGEHFAAGAHIIFLLDGASIISGTNGQEISLLTSNQGTFDVAIPSSTWSTGEHLISAQDNRNGQSAYLNIKVS